MKRFSRVLGFVGLSALALACSSRDQDPPSFAAQRDLAAELAAQYGAPFAVEYQGSTAFWASPLGNTRALASTTAQAEAVARDFVTRFGRDFGAGDSPASIRITRSEGDETGGLVVRFAEVVPGTDIEILNASGAIDIASDGTLRSAAATLVPQGIPSFFAPANVDAHYNTALVDAAFRRVVKDGPSRDGVLAALTHANTRVVRVRLPMPDGSYTWKEEVDSSAQFNASWDPFTNRVGFGDGGLYGTRYMFPTGIALDIVGHEWTHAFMSRKTGFLLAGEDGAIQETVSDAVGKSIAIYNGDKVEDTIGGKLFFAGGALRSFVKPSDVEAQTEIVDSNGKGRAGMAKSPEKVADLNYGCIVSLNVDMGCVHLNAGPGNRAFYLMKQGLKQVAPTATAANGKVTRPWLERLEAVWFYSAGHAVRGPSAAGGSYGALALQQMDLARTWGPQLQKPIACAWLSVGAVSPKAVGARGIRCAGDEKTDRAAPVPSDCGGKPDGVYCNESVPFSATRCKGGSIAGGEQCVPGQVCVVEDPRTGAAKLTESGSITCREAP